MENLMEIELITKRRMKAASQYLDFLNTNNRHPRCTSHDVKEKNLAYWRARIQRDKNLQQDLKDFILKEIPTMFIVV
jgi:hypothetical protein